MIGKTAFVSFAVFAVVMAAKTTFAGISDFVVVEPEHSATPASLPVLVPTRPIIETIDPEISTAAIRNEYAVPDSIGLEEPNSAELVPLPLPKPEQRVNGADKLKIVKPRAAGKSARPKAERVRPATARLISMSDLMLPIVGSYR